MSMIFKRKIEEKKCERDGRIIAECRVVLALPFSEGEDSDDLSFEKAKNDRNLSPMNNIRETLGAFFDAAMLGAEDFFGRALKKYEANCGDERFYTYRMTIDISASPEPFLVRDTCFAEAERRRKKAVSKRCARKCAGHCLSYSITCCVIRRARVIYKQKRNVAFRLGDGYMCTIFK